MNYCLAVFNTTFETLRAEEFFRAEKVRFRPVLKPRKIGSACRMALKFREEDIPKAGKAVSGGNLELLGFYRQEEDGWVKME